MKEGEKNKREGHKTHGPTMRVDKLKTQIELTFKQMNTAGTELDCFLALQRQEKLAASFRIKNIWEEVQKQKELEKTLQKRYGDLVAEVERVQQLMDQYRIQAQKLEEMEAKKNAEELAQPAADQADVPGSGMSEPLSTMEVDSSNYIKPEDTDATEVTNTENSRNDMHVDGDLTTVMDTQDTPVASEAPPKDSSNDPHVMESNVDNTEVPNGVRANLDKVVGGTAERDGFVNGDIISSSKVNTVEVIGDQNNQMKNAEVNEPLPGVDGGDSGRVNNDGDE